MGYARKGKYESNYIPFGVVLKKNFLLQEEVAVLRQQLQETLNSVSIYEQRIEYLILEKSEALSNFNRELEGFQKNHVAIESLVHTMMEEKRKSQTKCQENVKLALQLKESEVKIKELEAELRNHQLQSLGNHSKGRVDCESQKPRVVKVDSDRNILKGKNDKRESVSVNSSTRSDEYDKIGSNTSETLCRSTKKNLIRVGEKDE